MREKVNSEWFYYSLTMVLFCVFQPLDYWVRVHSLKSLSDGGILDFDDRLSDVTDDREQVSAQRSIHTCAS